MSSAVELGIFPASQNTSANIPLVVIVGPTAVGKTKLSLDLAECIHGEIVSADSRLFYRGMDIGTAKPSLADRIRIPHHLIDVADPDQVWSLPIFQQAAYQAIMEIHLRGNPAILVGGTGQYVRAILHGWSPPAAPPDPAIRAELEAQVAKYGYAHLFEKLRQVDPAAAEIIDPRNYRRTIRALEVIRLTGKKFSELRSQSVSQFHPIIVGLNRPRSELYSRIDARIESMFSDGLLDEVRVLLSKSYSPDLPAMSSIGYWESIQVLNNALELSEAKESMCRRTRVFVRRQANWFRFDDPSIHWFTVTDGFDLNILELVTRFLQVS